MDGEDVTGAMPVVSGEKVTDGVTLTSSWLAQLSVPPGGRVECGLDGSFSGMARSGVIAPGVMSPPIQITHPGQMTGSFQGSNAETGYTVDYVVTVQPQGQ